MKVTKAMIECYTNAFDFVMDAAGDPSVNSETLLTYGNRLYGMYEIMLAVVEKTNDKIPDNVESMMRQYDNAVTQKIKDEMGNENWLCLWDILKGCIKREPNE